MSKDETEEEFFVIELEGKTKVEIRQAIEKIALANVLDYASQCCAAIGPIAQSCPECSAVHVLFLAAVNAHMLHQEGVAEFDENFISIATEQFALTLRSCVNEYNTQKAQSEEPDPKPNTGPTDSGPCTLH